MIYEWIGQLTRSGKLERFGALLLRIMPESWIFAMIAALGRLLYGLAFRTRDRITRNMREIMSDTDPERIRNAVRDYFLQLSLALFELLALSGRLQKEGRELIRMDGEEHLQEALKEGRGTILYAPHAGNFFYYYWALSQKYDCLSVVTAASPELRPIYLLFQQLGCKGLDYDETPPMELLRRLRSHLAGGGVVFLLGDFYRPQFPPTRLFGRNTRGPAGAALLALEQRVPVIPCFGYREKGFRHRLELWPPVKLYETYDRKDRSKAMEELNRLMEQQILLRPEQWFYWFQSHERWESVAARTGTE